jgi:hypothetical protein
MKPSTILLAALLATGTVGAQTNPGPGPYLPPDKRTPSSEPAASGPALRMQAIQKLKQRFEQADLDGNGRLTRDEASKAGLGFVVQHFDEIDSAHRGAVSFDELKAYLVERRKQARAQHVPGNDKLP